MLFEELPNIAETRKTDVLLRRVTLPGKAFSFEALATVSEVKVENTMLLALAV